jgi:hypothetical protein
MSEQAAPKRDPRALNAYRHGLTGQVVLRTEGEQQAYDLHCKGLLESLAPVGAVELQLAQGIVDDQWRLNRGRAIEENGFSCGIHTSDGSTDNHAELFGAIAIQATWFKDAKSIGLLGLYVDRIRRALERSMKQLKELQAERHAALQKLAEEANLLLELAESRRESYDIERDFPPHFVFSSQEIVQLATYLRRLAQAKVHEKARQAFQKRAA